MSLKFYFKAACPQTEMHPFHRQLEVLVGAPGWESIVLARVTLTGRNHIDLLDGFVDVDGVLSRGLTG